jgi:hypothetical protein
MLLAMLGLKGVRARGLVRMRRVTLLVLLLVVRRELSVLVVRWVRLMIMGVLCADHGQIQVQSLHNLGHLQQTLLHLAPQLRCRQLDNT